MSRVAFLALSLVLLAGPAVAQLPNLNNPNPPCWMCVESPSAGSFSERHYQRQQRQRRANPNTWQQYAPPPAPAPPSFSNRESLNDRAYRDPTLSYGSHELWPTPELQMQYERNALEDYKAGYGCNSWSLDDC